MIQFTKFNECISMGLTVGSVFEHAYGEVKKRGMFDIEILPATISLKSFFTEQKLSTVLNYVANYLW